MLGGRCATSHDAGIDISSPRLKSAAGWQDELAREKSVSPFRTSRSYTRHGDQVHSRLPRLEPPRLRGPIQVRPFGPLCRPVRLCITVVAMSDETEAHEYRLGSPLASIIGLADATLEREDLDEDVATRVRAIRDI